MTFTLCLQVKFSDAFAGETLSDTSSAYALARRILTTYHPAEPEMWMTLASHLLPQFQMGGTFQPYVVPIPCDDLEDRYVKLYEESAWRGDMTLLEFMRKTNKDGIILNHIKKSYDKTDKTMTLEEYTINFETFGEKCIACEVCSMTSDKFYGQWLLLNVPFEKAADLMPPEVLATIPHQHKFIAAALQLRPDMWADEDKIRQNAYLIAGHVQGKEEKTYACFCSISFRHERTKCLLCLAQCQALFGDDGLQELLERHHRIQHHGNQASMRAVLQWHSQQG